MTRNYAVPRRRIKIDPMDFGTPVTGTLGDEPSLEVRDGAENVKHELAGGRGGVEALLEADQVDTSGLEVVDGLEQLPERAAQTVEASDAQAVSGPGVVDELGEPGTLETLSGDDVGEHPDRAGLDEACVLRLRVLVVRGHAGVAQGVAGTRRCGGINIGRFGDGFRGHAVCAVQRP